MIDERRTDRDDELVERLLRLAGTDSEIPADGARRVREAVRPLWEREVRFRVLRRRMMIGFGAVAAAVIVVAAVSVLRGERPLDEVPSVATVELVRGTVTVGDRGGSFSMISEGQAGIELKAGATVRTVSDSRVALRLEGGRSLRLDHDTEVRLDGGLVIGLEYGGLYVDSSGGDGDGVQVVTSVGSVREIGTRFEVRTAAKTLQVRVRDGEVVVSRGASRFDVTRGEALWVSSEGAPTRHPVAGSSAEWSWVQQVAPPYEIEGRTVAGFLDWVARETGMRVVYAGPEIGRFAADTVLHGTMGDLTPELSVDVVLASCGLVAERKDHILAVDRGPPRSEGWPEDHG